MRSKRESLAQLSTSSMPEFKNILVVGPSWVGDMVMAQSLFIRLKQLYPESTISVLAPPWTLPLIERMPEVVAGISLPFGHGDLKLRERRQFGRSLRSKQFDTAFILPNSLKSALIPFHAKIPIRIGWRGEMRSWILNDCRVLDKSALPLMVQRFVALAENGIDSSVDYPKPALKIDKKKRQVVVTEKELNTQKPVLGICPGAEFGTSKQWPAAHYAELAMGLMKAGWQVWLFGSNNDAVVASEIQGRIDISLQENFRNLAGKTNLSEAIDLMSLATAVVSNDSGLMHIAAALELPVVGIYGSTSPDFTPPLSERVKLLSLDLDCRPCFKRECPLQHLNCLNQLPATAALTAVRELI